MSDFLTLVEEYKALHNCGNAEAIKAQSKTHKKEWQEYISGANSKKPLIRATESVHTTASGAVPDFMDLVERYMIDFQVSKAKAISAVGQKHPESRKAYLIKAQAGGRC